MRPVLSWYQNQTKAKKGKSKQTNINHELRHKNLQPNISRLNPPIYRKNYTLWPSGIYSCMQSWFHIQNQIQYSKSINRIYNSNWKKKKNQLIESSIGTEKALYKINHPLMIKTLKKVVIKGNLTKKHLLKSASIILNIEKLKRFLRLGTRQYISTPIYNNK